MRILIHDTHELFVDAVSYLLTSHGHEVLTSEEAAEALGLVSPLGIDVLLIGVDPAHAVDVELFDGLAALSPPVPIVVLTADEERHEAVEARWPVVCLSKRASADSILSTLEQVCGALPWHAPRLAPPSAPSATSEADTHLLARFLTAREREVLEGLVHGESTDVLARRFGVRPATIRSHVQNLLTKLGVHSRTAAVAYAVEHGLVDLRRGGDRRAD